MNTTRAWRRKQKTRKGLKAPHPLFQNPTGGLLDNLILRQSLEGSPLSYVPSANGTDFPPRLRNEFSPPTACMARCQCQAHTRCGPLLCRLAVSVSDFHFAHLGGTFVCGFDDRRRDGDAVSGRKGGGRRADQPLVHTIDSGNPPGPNPPFRSSDVIREYNSGVVPYA